MNVSSTCLCRCNFTAFMYVVHNCATQQKIITESQSSTWFFFLTVIQHGSAPVARQYAKYGCPPGLRREVWCLILGLEVDDVVCHSHDLINNSPDYLPYNSYDVAM